MTGYQYAGNNPIMGNDPMGDKVFDGYVPPDNSDHWYWGDKLERDQMKQNDLAFQQYLDSQNSGGGGFGTDFKAFLYNLVDAANSAQTNFSFTSNALNSLYSSWSKIGSNESLSFNYASNGKISNVTLPDPIALGTLLQTAPVIGKANQGGPIRGIHVIYESETPTIYRNTLNALKNGLPYILHYEPSLISANRGNMLKGYPSVSRSVQRDEYPYASTREGGNGMVFYVPGRENSIQGAHLSMLYSTLKPGDAFLVFLIAKGQEPENEWAPHSNPIQIAPAVKAGAAVGAILTILTWLSRIPAL